MTDKELLELAAKAAGIEIKWATQLGNGTRPDEMFSMGWNPLLNDGDALRLAVQLKLEIEWWKTGVNVSHPVYAPMPIEHLENDPYATTRRAIVRAAAEIGKTL
jgi:hypothetical protein